MVSLRKPRRPNIDATSRTINKQLSSRRQNVVRQAAIEALQDKGPNFAEVKYLPLDSASPIIIQASDLVDGLTILGIRTTGAVSVELPIEANDKNRVIVKDERGTAAADNITVTVT